MSEKRVIGQVATRGVWARVEEERGLYWGLVGSGVGAAISSYDSEYAAWCNLITSGPEAFTWQVQSMDGEEGVVTATHCAESAAAARAMVDTIRSLGGACLETEGGLVYVIADEDSVTRDLAFHGFHVVEIQ